MSQQHAKEKQRVAAWSLFASGALLVAKFAVALLSGSLSLLSDAFSSLMDFAATSLTFFAIRISEKPADSDHHYGHAKVENIAALAQAAMLFAVTGWVVYEAARRLLSGRHDIELSWWVFVIIICSILIDGNRSRALRRTAEKTGSAALAADALHFAADMWSSWAVLIGLALVWWGYAFADALAALVVAFFVARAAWILGRQTLDNLLDAAPAGVTAEIENIVTATDGVIELRQLRVRPAGPQLYVDVVAGVPRIMPAATVETLRLALLDRIRERFSNADCSIQLQPLELDSETAFEKVALIAARHDLSVHHLVVQNLKGRLAVSFDVEMDAQTTLQAAHDKATELEVDIRDGLGGDVEVESHIEPRVPQLLDGAPPRAAVVRSVEKALHRLASREQSLCDLHNIRVRRNRAGLYVHYHCRFAPDLSIADVHDVCDRIEMALMAEMAVVRRVVAHAEPVGATQHAL